MTAMGWTIVAIATAAIVWASWIVTGLRAELNAARDRAQRLIERLESAHARLRDVEPREASFRHALGFYGDEETWVAPGRSHSAAFRDRGRIARDTLRASR